MRALTGSRTVQEQYDSVATGYDAQTSGAHWLAYEHLTWRRILVSAPPPGPGVKVLDAGGGTGKWTLRLAEAGYDVVLLDPSDGMLAQARVRLEARGLLPRVRLVQGDVTRIDFPDESFDFVLCEGDPLSYCVGRERDAARELLRVARGGARVLVGCDNRFLHALHALAGLGDPDLALRIESRGEALDPYRLPVHAFSPAELRLLFESEGAVVESVEGKPILTQFVSSDVLAKWYSDADLRERLLALEERLAAEPSLVGVGGHLQIVVRKQGGPRKP